MQILSYDELMKDTNVTTILLFRNWLVEYYLSKGFVILEHNFKTLISVPNEEKM